MVLFKVISGKDVKGLDQFSLTGYKPVTVQDGYVFEREELVLDRVMLHNNPRFTGKRMDLRKRVMDQTRMNSDEFRELATTVEISGQVAFLHEGEVVVTPQKNIRTM